MRSLTTRLVMVMTVSFLVLALAQSDPTAAVIVTGVAVLAIAAFAGARHVTIAIAWVTLTIGARSHLHREVLSRIAAPRHPNTPGRTQARAPSQPEVLA